MVCNRSKGVVKSDKNSMTSEAHLIKDCLQGNRKAQNDLYSKYKVKLFGLCLRYARSREEAEDFLLEGFQKIFRDLHQFKFKSSLEAWMRRVVVNTALQHLRKKNRLSFQDFTIEEIDRVSNFEPDILDEMNANDIIACIQKLPIGYQTIFNLFAIEGYSHREISEQLGITESTSRSQYTRAKKALQKILIESNIVEIKI